MLMQIPISTHKKWKVWNQFLQFKTAPVVEIETKPMIMYNNHEPASLTSKIKSTGRGAVAITNGNIALGKP